MTRPAAIALSAAALLAGCAAHRHGLATASVVRAGSRCGGEAGGPSARWIGSDGELRAALSSEAALAGPGEASPRVDFSSEGVVAIFAGMRPTAGYAVALHENAVTIADGVATLVVRFEEPPPGAILAQVLTSPCLLVRIPRAGIREVRVVDPSGKALATAR